MRWGRCQPGGPTAFLLWGRDARDEPRVDLAFVSGRTGPRRHLAWLLSFVGTLGFTTSGWLKIETMIVLKPIKVHGMV
jgi:hypothetical protein